MTSETTTAPWPHRMTRLSGYVLHAAKARPSGAFETACGWLSGPGDNKHHDDQRPVTCRECKRRLAREEREAAR